MYLFNRETADLLPVLQSRFIPHFLRDTRIYEIRRHRYFPRASDVTRKTNKINNKHVLLAVFLIPVNFFITSAFLAFFVRRESIPGPEALNTQAKKQISRSLYIFLSSFMFISPTVFRIHFKNVNLPRRKTQSDNLINLFRNIYTHFSSTQIKQL